MHSEYHSFILGDDGYRCFILGPGALLTPLEAREWRGPACLLLLMTWMAHDLKKENGRNALQVARMETEILIVLNP